MIRSRLGRVTTLTLWTVWVTSACGPALKSTDQRAFTVKVVSKNDETPFYSRLATDSSRVIVTDQSASSQSGVDIKLAGDEQLYVIELDHEESPKLNTEFFREERLVLFTARDEREASLIAGKSFAIPHPRKVELRTLKFPAEMLSSRPHIIPPSQMQTLTLDINAGLMREDLESLSGARPVIINGQSTTITNRASIDNKTKARAWLRANYEALGYTVTEHRYDSGINLVAEKRPAAPIDDQIFMVSSHLDTVQTAGADDDGSGTISSLTIARALANVDLKRTIRFVAFDEEERGLVGSSAYAQELSSAGTISKVSLMNIEMTGYDSDNDGDFHTIDCNENSSPQLSRALLNAITNEGIALKKVEACTNRSDHAAFWDYNRPAIVISQNFFGGDGNPCYHRSCDTVQKVNWDYMEKLTRAAANAVYNLNR